MAERKKKNRIEMHIRKGSFTHMNSESHRIARRGKNTFLSEQCKEIEENNRMGKIKDLFKKIRDRREHFMQRWAQ